jgi:hypothetical protein
MPPNGKFMGPVTKTDFAAKAFRPTTDSTLAKWNNFLAGTLEIDAGNPFVISLIDD